jgi:hypothetical protein
LWKTRLGLLDLRGGQCLTEVGKLSAEAIVGEYEAAAKEIEAMGAELIERVRQCETMAQDALAVTKEMKDTAARLRSS